MQFTTCTTPSIMFSCSLSRLLFLPFSTHIVRCRYVNLMCFFRWGELNYQYHFRYLLKVPFSFIFGHQRPFYIFTQKKKDSKNITSQKGEEKGKVKALLLKRVYINRIYAYLYKTKKKKRKKKNSPFISSVLWLSNCLLLFLKKGNIIHPPYSLSKLKCLSIHTNVDDIYTWAIGA